MWLYRRKDGSLWMSEEKPDKINDFRLEDPEAEIFLDPEFDIFLATIEINSELFPEVTYENSPVKLKTGIRPQAEYD